MKIIDRLVLRRALLVGWILCAFTVQTFAQLGIRFLGQHPSSTYMNFFCDPNDENSLCTANCANLFSSQPNGDSGNTFDRQYFDIGMMISPPIPLVGTNAALLCVRPAIDSSAVKLSPTNPGVVSFAQDPTSALQAIPLTPETVGVASLLSPGNSNPSPLANYGGDQLGTYVFPPFPAGGGPLTIAFHIVKDSNNISAGLTQDQVTAIVSAAQVSVNSVWNQVNVRFVASGPANNVTAPFSTTPMQNADASGNETQDEINLFNNNDTPGVLYNVYFVYQLKNDVGDTYLDPDDFHCDGQGGLVTEGETLIAVYNDDGTMKTLSEIADTTAHELGHSLGLDNSVKTDSSGNVVFDSNGNPITIPQTYRNYTFSGIDSSDSTFGYQVMANEDGKTVTPAQRDCISTVRF